MSSVTKNYHKMFKNIKDCTLEAVKNIVRTDKLWRVARQDEEAGYELLRKLCSQLSECYNLPVPTLKKGYKECYWIQAERIELPKVSLVSFLHEYRHHMQKHGKQHYDDHEVDARAWSISCFHLALPPEFDNAWKKGLIWFMPPYPGE